MKKENQKYLISICLVVILTGVTLYLTLKDEKDQILSLLDTLTSEAFLVIVFLSLAYMACVGISIYLITKTKYSDYKLRQAFVNGMIGQFFCGVTPGASGGQAGQVYVFSKQKIPATDALSILYLDFIIYQITLIGYTFILLVWKMPKFYRHYPFLLTLIIIGFLVNAAILVGLWTIQRFPEFYKRISVFIVKIANKLHIVHDQQSTLDKWKEILENFVYEIKRNSSNYKLLIQLFLINLLKLTIYFAIPYIIGNAMGIKLELWNTIALSSFVSMANAFFPVPGATGGTEFMFLSLFTLLISVSEAKSVMLCWRFSTFHLIMILGGMTFILFKIFHQKRSE